MKKTFVIPCFVAIILLGTFQSCKKSNSTEESNGCKSCKAFATPSQTEVVKEVCSNQAEQDFRLQYAGREISCR